MSLPMRRLVAAGLCLAAGLAGTALLAPPAQAAPPLSGKQIVSASSPNTSASEKTVQAKCPAGKVVISGGAFVNGPQQVKLTALQPVPTGNLFQASARNPYGRAAWSLSTYAVCATRPAGLVYLSADSVPVAWPHRIAMAQCPAGKQVIGIGGLAAVEPGRNVTLEVVVPPGNVNTAWVKSHAAQGGEPQNWTARAYAVCADALGASTVWAGGPTGSASTRTNWASCAPGKLAAIGAMTDSDSGQVGFGAIYPDATLTTGVAFASEDQDGYAGNWSLAAWAICA